MPDNDLSSQVKELSQQQIEFLKFASDVINQWPVIFPKKIGNPHEFLQKFLNGEISYNLCIEYRERIWVYIDNSGFDRDFQDRDAIAARIGLCLIPNKVNFEFIEIVNWFIDFCGKLGMPRDHLLKSAIQKLGRFL